MEKTTLTSDQVYEALRTARADLPITAKDDLIYDARVQLLKDLTNQVERYEHQLKWLARDVQDLVLKYDVQGIASVYDTVLRTSLIDDVKEAASKIAAITRALECTCRTADDSKSDAIDALVRTLNDRTPAEQTS